MSSDSAIVTPCWLCGGEASEDPVYAGTPLVRCADCGFLFDSGHSAEELQELYGDSYFEDYPQAEGGYSDDEAQRRMEATKRLEWIARWKQSGRLFEVGAAAGFFLDEARKVGFEVSGVEPGPTVSQFARDSFGLDVQTGFLEQIELPEDPFDVVCMFHVLEHIHSPAAVLRELREHTVVGGMLFVEIPNIESVVARKSGADWKFLDLPNHVGFYSPDHLAKLFGDAGYELVGSDSVSEYFYYRTVLKLRPQTIGMRSLKRLRTGTPQGKVHPINHPLLRAVARAV